MEVAALFAGVNPVERDRLSALCQQFNKTRDEKLAAFSGDHSSLVYEALDLDLGQLLVQILPIVLSLFTSGMSITLILGLAKTIIGFLVKDSELAALLYQIIEILAGLLAKK